MEKYIEEIKQVVAFIDEIDLDVREKVLLHIPSAFGTVKMRYEQEIWPKLSGVRDFLNDLSVALIELDPAGPVKIEDNPCGLGSAAETPFDTSTHDDYERD